MMPTFHVYKTPALLKWLYPSCVWHKENEHPTIYLTFDDGPVPNATPYVLQCLREYSAKATFFCVGENIAKHADVMAQVVSEGHSVGNHTYNHIKGWQTSDQRYFDNVGKCEDMIVQSGASSSKKLFRPPYGRITPSQVKSLRKQYEIIMWDVLSGDYNSALRSEDILSNLIKVTNSGSIVVFHDSHKALPHLQQVLKPYLEHFAQKGYVFKSL